MQDQCKTSTRCSVRHSGVTIYVIQASRFYCGCALLACHWNCGVLINCNTNWHIVTEKVSFTPHENQDLPCNKLSYQCNGYNFEVFRTCRGSVVMAIVYVVMTGLTV